MNTNFRAAPQQNASQGVTKVPAGVYVAKIVGVKEEADQYGPQLKLALDIAEGEYADAYKRRYEADVEYARNNPGNSREAKWKGTIKYRIPEGRDPEHDSRNEARLNDALWRIEQSRDRPAGDRRGGADRSREDHEPAAERRTGAAGTRGGSIHSRSDTAGTAVLID